MKRFFQTFGMGLLITLPVVLALRSSVLESFHIPTGSMIPTILIGDHVLVWKSAYRWKLPFSEFLSDPVILKVKEGPQRGDVIVFRYPRDMTIHYIKRVVGVSGDWIAIKNRQLLINDSPVPAADVSAEKAEEVKARVGDPLKDFLLREEDLSGKLHLILHDRNQFVSERYGPIAVPPGHVFVMGDNRDFSDDSRFWGFVPLSLIEGKALRSWLRLRLAFEPFQFDWSLSRVAYSL